MKQGKQQDRIAYVAGPVLTDQGAGFYMVHRVNHKRVTFFVQETILPIDEDDAYTMTEINAEGKPGRVFTAASMYANDVIYDGSQTYEGSYDYCRCGGIKAASTRRCPICRIERIERRQAFADKVIANYLRQQKRAAKEARRAEKRAVRLAAEQAAFDGLRPRPTLDEAALKAADASWTLIGQAATAIKGWFAKSPKEPVQMALPFNME